VKLVKTPPRRAVCTTSHAHSHVPTPLSPFTTEETAKLALILPTRFQISQSRYQIKLRNQIMSIFDCSDLTVAHPDDLWHDMNREPKPTNPHNVTTTACLINPR